MNGADEDSLGMTYGVYPDVDGHSVWANRLPWGSDPDNINGDVQYQFAKIDLATKTVTKTWNYEATYDQLLDMQEGTGVFFVDAAGKVWHIPGRGSANHYLIQNDPDDTFAELQRLGNQADPTTSQYIVEPSGYALMTHAGHEWLVMFQWSAFSPVIVDLTDGTVIGNWWVTDENGNFSNSDFNGMETRCADVFVDSDNNIWFVHQVITGNSFADEADLIFCKWNPADGTTTQPTNFYNYQDPFLNNVDYTVVPAALTNSTGQWLSDGGQVKAQYRSATNSVLVGTAQNVDITGNGDLAVISLADFTRSAWVPFAGTAASLYTPDNGEDIGAFMFMQNSKLRWIDNEHAATLGSSATSGTTFGAVLNVLNDDLTVSESHDLAEEILSADPLAAAGYRWAYGYPFNNLISGSGYKVGDIVGTGQNTNLYVALVDMFPLSQYTPWTDDGTHWLAVAPDSEIQSSGLIYRGSWRPGVIYAANDVVWRDEYPSDLATDHPSGDRFFTAMRTSTGVDAYNASSADWFPATNSPWFPSGYAHRQSMSGPAANMLFYEDEGWIVFTFDFVGSPLYLLELNATPPCRRVSITGGAFQDSLGNPLAGGQLEVQLNTDARACDGNQIGCKKTIYATLDSDGNVPSGALSLYPNSKLTSRADVDTAYFMRVFSSKGQLVWSSIVTVTNTSPFDLGTVTPVAF